MEKDNLIIESVSNGPLFGQTFNVEMLNSLPSIKRKFILSRVPFIPYSVKSKLFSLSKKEINSNGLILHGGGPIYSNGTISENECCNPLELNPKDPNFIEKTSGGLKLVDNDPIEQTAKYQEKVIENFLKSKELKSNFVGIGFAIEWVAGTKIKAPEFLANIGLEWVFRLIQEPKRLYKRYFVDNSLFVFYFVKQILLNDKRIETK